jgi:hypothetical protein
MSGCVDKKYIPPLVTAAEWGKRTDTRPKIPNWLLDIDSSSFPRPSVLMSRKGKRQNQNKEEQQETYLAEQEN